MDGLCAGTEVAPAVFLSPRGAAVSADLAHRYPNVRVCASNQEVADNASVIIVAVRPDALHDALAQVRMAPGAVAVSVVAGVEHEDLRTLFGSGVTVVRAIPLPAVRRRDSITATYRHTRR